jgi:transcriptional regulator with XRE-family HTH domain
MTSAPDFAARLRGWRQQRGWSQLELAGRAEISQRHLSFLELGRANPSRDMVVRLANTLDVPLREHNALLLAAGFAPRRKSGGRAISVRRNWPACERLWIT